MISQKTLQLPITDKSGLKGKENRGIQSNHMKTEGKFTVTCNDFVRCTTLRLVAPYAANLRK